MSSFQNPSTNRSLAESLRTHDNTMMSDWAYCQRLYAIKHILNKRRRVVSAPLGFGSLIHIGLDAYYSSFAEDERNSRPRDIATAAEAAYVKMEAQPYEDPEDGYRTKGRAIQVMLEYIKEYNIDPRFSEIAFSETPFEIIQKDGFRWGGIIDMWAKYEGRYWPVDHKSTSIFGQYYFDNFKRNPQMLGYVLGASEFHGQQAPGVIINVIHVVKTKTEFFYRPILYPQWLVDEAKEMQRLNYIQIEDRVVRMTDPEDIWNPNLFQPNLYNCIGKYGRCEAYSVCDAMPENRSRALAMDFEDHVWDWSNRDE